MSLKKGTKMGTALQDNTLLDTEEKHQQMARLIILKLAAAWLEKQDWLNSPYGGQNPVQDLLFQTQLTANCIWEDFFSKKENHVNYDMKYLRRQILEMSDLTPELREFFKNQTGAKLENNPWI